MSEIEATCAIYAEDFSALLDDELAEERAVEVRGHLESCPDCTGRIDALRRVDPALVAAPAPGVPADLRARLDARLSSEGRAARGRGRTDLAASRRGRARWFAHPSVGVAAAAAAALALYVGVPTVPTVHTPIGPIGPIGPAGSMDVDASEPQIAGTDPESMTPESPRATHVLETLASTSGAGSRGEPVADVDLDDLSDEELAMALEFDTIEDLQVIANLDLLVRLLEVEEAG